MNVRERQNGMLLHVLLVESARSVRLAPVLQSNHLISTTRDIYLFSLPFCLFILISQPIEQKSHYPGHSKHTEDNSPNLTLLPPHFGFPNTSARRFSAPRRAPPLARSSSPALHRLLSSSHSEIHLLTHENLSTVRTESLYTCARRKTNLDYSF
jgi:hypothetical protein